MVCSLNSSMASTDRIAAGVPRAVSMFDVPSIMKLFEVGRAPMMLIALPDALPHRPLLAVGLHRARAQEQQRQEVPPVERQVRDLLLGDDLADGRRLGVEGDRARLHLDHLRQPSRLQIQVDADDLIDDQADAGPLGGTEALQRRRHRIDADGQERDHVVAVLPGDGLALRAGQLARDRDRRPGHHRPGGVLDGTGDLAGGGLRARGGRRCPSSASTAPSNRPFLMAGLPLKHKLPRPACTHERQN